MYGFIVGLFVGLLCGFFISTFLNGVGSDEE